MEQFQKLPGASWVARHPRVSAWFVLSLGMVILLIIEARDVGLLMTQWVALIVATVLVAGLCVWIVSWEDNNDSDDVSDGLADNAADNVSVGDGDAESVAGAGTTSA